MRVRSSWEEVIKILSSYKNKKNVIKSSNVKKENPEEALVDIATELTRNIKRENIGQEESLKENTGLDFEENKDTILSEYRKELEVERQELIADAEKEIESLKEEAQAAGFQEGQTQGYQLGRQEGYESILGQAQEEAEEIKARMQKEAQDYVDGYLKKNRNNIIDLALTMAESIVYYEIDKSDTGLIDLLDKHVDGYMEVESIIIRCHPKAKEQIVKHLDRLEEKSPATKFFLISDSKLAEHDLILESEDQVIDLDIEKQIESIRETIRNVE